MRFRGNTSSGIDPATGCITLVARQGPAPLRAHGAPPPWLPALAALALLVRRVNYQAPSSKSQGTPKSPNSNWQRRFGVFGVGSALELGAWSLGFDTPRITRTAHN